MSKFLIALVFCIIACVMATSAVRAAEENGNTVGGVIGKACNICKSACGFVKAEQAKTKCNAFCDSKVCLTFGEQPEASSEGLSSIFPVEEPPRFVLAEQDAAPATKPVAPKKKPATKKPKKPVASKKGIKCTLCKKACDKAKSDEAKTKCTGFCEKRVCTAGPAKKTPQRPGKKLLDGLRKKKAVKPVEPATPAADVEEEAPAAATPATEPAAKPAKKAGKKFGKKHAGHKHAAKKGSKKFGKKVAKKDDKTAAAEPATEEAAKPAKKTRKPRNGKKVAKKVAKKFAKKDGAAKPAKKTGDKKKKVAKKDGKKKHAGHKHAGHKHAGHKHGKKDGKKTRKPKKEAAPAPATPAEPVVAADAEAMSEADLKLIKLPCILCKRGACKLIKDQAKQEKCEATCAKLKFCKKAEEKKQPKAEEPRVETESDAEIDWSAIKTKIGGFVSKNKCNLCNLGCKLVKKEEWKSKCTGYCASVCGTDAAPAEQPAAAADEPIFG